MERRNQRKMNILTIVCILIIATWLLGSFAQVQAETVAERGYWIPSTGPLYGGPPWKYSDSMIMVAAQYEVADGSLPHGEVVRGYVAKEKK